MSLCDTQSYPNMQKCTKCKCSKHDTEFGFNRKNVLYKTCERCRLHDKQYRDSKKINEVYTPNDNWKLLFNAHDSTHCDFSSYLLAQGWTEVHDIAVVSAY